jgi:hypothetical protein
MLVVGLEQTASPDCSWLTFPGTNTINTWSCGGRTNCFNRLFFYRLEIHDNGVDSLCTSELRDFSIDERGVSRDEGFFEQPKWPAGEWPLKLFGKDFTYTNSGENPVRCGRKVVQMQLVVWATCRYMVRKTQIVIERKKLILVDP